jgi:cyclophilin family peptidyl-prolyl cis-trans isomerase
MHEKCNGQKLCHVATNISFDNTKEKSEKMNKKPKTPKNTNINKKITAGVAAACIALTSLAELTACGGDTGLMTDSPKTKPKDDKITVLNYVQPVEGEDIVVLNIDGYGEIKIKVFEEELKEASVNFKELAKRKYYDNLIIHRVVKNFMIQGGSPGGDGYGGESIYGGQFEGGVSDRLYHFTGAVCYANSGSTATNTSQFYIVLGDEYDDLKLDSTESRIGRKYSQEVRDLYKKNGGVAFLDGGYTVFGQVVEGMDVVEAIGNVKVGPQDPTSPNSEKSRPAETITIKEARVEQWTIDN